MGPLRSLYDALDGEVPAAAADAKVVVDVASLGGAKPTCLDGPLLRVEDEGGGALMAGLRLGPHTDFVAGEDDEEGPLGEVGPAKMGWDWTVAAG